MKKNYLRWLAGQLKLSCSHSATLNPWLLNAPLQFPSGIFTFRNKRGEVVTMEV